MRYESIDWWLVEGQVQGWHVYDLVPDEDGKLVETRIGVVNRRTVYRNGLPRHSWHAHNKHFFTVPPPKGRKHFASKAEAAAALPREAIHHGSEAIARAA